MSNRRGGKVFIIVFLPFIITEVIINEKKIASSSDLIRFIYRNVSHRLSILNLQSFIKVSIHSQITSLDGCVIPTIIAEFKDRSLYDLCVKALIILECDENILSELASIDLMNEVAYLKMMLPSKVDCSKLMFIDPKRAPFKLMKLKDPLLAEAFSLASASLPKDVLKGMRFAVPNTSLELISSLDVSNDLDGGLMLSMDLRGRDETVYKKGRRVYLRIRPLRLRALLRPCKVGRKPGISGAYELFYLALLMYSIMNYEDVPSEISQLIIKIYRELSKGSSYLNELLNKAVLDYFDCYFIYSDYVLGFLGFKRDYRVKEILCKSLYFR